jgi:hypothetical protein
LHKLPLDKYVTLCDTDYVVLNKFNGVNTMTDTEYRTLISNGVTKAFGRCTSISVVRSEVVVYCALLGDGITYKQIMALREVFGADFDVAFEAEEGHGGSGGAYYPGRKEIVFSYTRPA